METAIEELARSRVRIEASVPAEEVRERVLRTARSLAAEVRVPGFRKGKTPPEIVVQRLGWAGVLEPMLREALPDWYERALLESGVAAVGEPKLDLSSLPAEGEPLSFALEVAVRPTAELGDYRGLEVGRAEPEVPEEAIDAELERLREGLASLRPVERAAALGDYLLVDYAGEIDGEPIDGGEARDFMLELGSEALLDGFDQGLTGATAGEEREIEVTFPDDYRPERLAGRTATFKVEVKEVREKQLPGLDDDLAAEASEFDTVEELRADLRERLAHVAEHRVDEQFREAAVDAAVAEATVDVPGDVVDARAEEIWSRVERSLQARGITAEAYLQMQGKSRDELISEARPDAEHGLKREAVLSAVADAEGIEVGEEEMLDALAGSEDDGEGDPDAPAKALEELRSSGRDVLLREDLRLRKAAEVVAGAATPISLSQAEARESLWTPEREREQKGSLWTPGDD